MNKVLLIASLIIIGLSINLYGGSNTKQYSQMIEHRHRDTLTANGSVFLNDSSITNSVSVNGALHIKHSTIGNLQANGEVKIETSSVNNEANINGSLLAIDSSFKGVLSVASQNTILKSCVVDQILIKTIERQNQVQSLELSGNTTVNGDIIFETPEGKVTLIGNAKLLGKVIGADVQYR